MKNNKKNKLIVLMVVLTLLTVLFIFSQSLPGIEVSKQESENVQEIVEPALEAAIGKGNVTNNLVRKLAHIAEYMVLGVELSVLSLLIGKHSIGYMAVTAVCTALCDETIQIFSKRGSQVQDVWLDISGAILGTMLVLLACFVFKLVAYVRKKNNHASVLSRSEQRDET